MSTLNNPYQSNYYVADSPQSDNSISSNSSSSDSFNHNSTHATHNNLPNSSLEFDENNDDQNQTNNADNFYSRAYQQQSYINNSSNHSAYTNYSDVNNLAASSFSYPSSGYASFNYSGPNNYYQAYQYSQNLVSPSTNNYYYNSSTNASPSFQSDLSTASSPIINNNKNLQQPDIFSNTNSVNYNSWNNSYYSSSGFKPYNNITSPTNIIKPEVSSPPLNEPLRSLNKPCNATQKITSCSKSGATNSKIKIELQDKDLWNQFNDIGNEMIITKSGRRMFPPLRVNINGLNASTKYYLIVDVVPMDDNRYKYQNCQWVVSGKADAHFGGRGYMHPDSAPDAPVKGSQWMKQTISFKHLKLTNNPHDREGYIILNSMHKYVPRLHIIEEGNKLVNTICFNEASFIAVTAYQNDLITKLKISTNPYAKGFRETQTRRKRSNSDDDSDQQNTNSKSIKLDHLENSYDRNFNQISQYENVNNIQENKQTHDSNQKHDYSSVNGQNLCVYPNFNYY